MTGSFVSLLLLPWSSRVVPRCQNGLPRCSRDAKMAPRMSKRMAPRMSKRMHQGSPMAIPRSQKGPAAEGVALKIRHTLQREQGVIGTTHHSGRPSPLPPAPPKSLSKTINFRASISARSFPCEICKNYENRPQ